MTFIKTDLDPLRRPELAQDERRPNIMPPVYLMSCDGHNSPSIYRFRDDQHMLETVAKWEHSSVDEVRAWLIDQTTEPPDMESELTVLDSLEELVTDMTRED